MIAEDYVSFQIAKLLKEKGFDELTLISYRLNGYSVQIPCRNGFDEGLISKITLQMAMKWLREVHKLDIIAPPQFDSIKWTYSAIIIKLSTPCTEIRLNDNKDKKEAAYETAIKYCLEKLI